MDQQQDWPFDIVVVVVVVWFFGRQMFNVYSIYIYMYIKSGKETTVAQQ